MAKKQKSMQSENPSIYSKNIIKYFVSLIAISLTIFQLYTGAMGPFPNIIQRAFHLGLALTLCFAANSIIKANTVSRKYIPFYDWIAIFLSVITTFYVVIHYNRIMSIYFSPNYIDILMGIVLTLLILEGTRRVIGNFMPILAIISIIYAYFGPYFPGRWMHKGIPIERIFEVLYMSTRGIWGLIMGLSATIIALFIIFGSILLSTGGAKTFMDLSIAISGKQVGGGAKVATIASGLFGSISGSAAANVATTGTVTIPMMKSLGYSPEFAAGVESTASTGGQLMPPIMGAGAFIMAELLGIPYLRIIKAGILPALLFYLGVMFSIHFESIKLGYIGLPKERITSLKSIFVWNRAAPIFVPLTILLILLFKKFTPTFACFWSIFAACVLFLFSDFNIVKISERLKILFYDAFKRAGKGIVTVAVLIACAQVILAMISTTGIGVKFSELIMALGGNRIELALIAAMIICIILGMGLPTSASYLLAASVVGPALVRLGLPTLVAHFFIFYFAIASGITPPICPTVFIGANIAKADWLATAKYALKIGIVAFVVPYLFIRSSSLLFIGSNFEALLTFFFSAIGVIALSGLVAGYFLRKNNFFENVLFLTSALFLLANFGIIYSLLGMVILIIVLIIQWNKVKISRKD